MIARRVVQLHPCGQFFAGSTEEKIPLPEMTGQYRSAKRPRTACDPSQLLAPPGSQVFPSTKGGAGTLYPTQRPECLRAEARRIGEDELCGRGVREPGCLDRRWLRVP